MAELGQATFFSAVRGSRTSDNPTPAGDGVPRLTVTPKLTVKGTRPDNPGKDQTATVNPAIQLLGPGDVIGISPTEVLRVFPASGEPAAEPNYLASIEFDSTELPWMASLSTTQDKPMPWIALVVVPDTGARISHRPGSSLPWLNARSSELPPCDEAWAWAHAQVVGKAADAHSLLGDGRRTVARLLCPTRLLPNVRYIAAVVPTYKAGVLTARGEDSSGSKDTAAWERADAELQLPVYHWWRFTTGAGGDFEQLARQLTAVDAADLKDIGRFPLRVAEGGLDGLPADTELHPIRTLLTTEAEIEAMAEEAANPEPTDAEVADALGKAINAAADEARTVRPPRFGQFPVGDLPAHEGDGPPWYSALNLTPSARVIARVGADIVRAQQEELVADAQRQLGAYQRARRARDYLRLGELSATRLHRRALDVVVAPDERVLAVARPAFDELAAAMDAPVASTFERQGLGAALLAPSLARIAQRAGRRTGLAAAALRTQLVAGVLDGTLAKVAEPPPRQGVEIDRLRRVFSRADILDRPIGQLTVDKVLTLAPSADSLQHELLTQFAGKRLAVHEVEVAEPLHPDEPIHERLGRHRHRVVLHPPGEVVAHPVDDDEPARALGHAAALRVHGLDVAAAHVAAPLAVAFTPVLLQHVATPIGAAFDPLRRLPDSVITARVTPNELALGQAASASLHAAVSVLSDVGVAAAAEEPTIGDLVVDAKTVAFAKQFAVAAGGEAEPQLAAFDVRNAARRKLGFSATQPVLRDQLSAEDRERFDLVVDLVSKRLLSDDVRFPAAPPPVTVAAAAAPCRVGLVAAKTYLVAASRQLVFADGLVPTEIQMGFVPTFEAPLVGRLARSLNHWILAGAANIPPNAVTMLVTNPRFVEALVAGANHEMGRELLWRDVPSDPRGTVFTRFWGRVPKQGEPLPRSPKIPPIHTWAGGLGMNVDPADPYVAVVLRSPLLRRFPNAVVYAAKGTVNVAEDNFTPDAEPPRYPLSTGFVEPDITFSVIELKESEARDPQQNWYLLLAEPLGEPRFGLDVERAGALTEWRDLAWTDTAAAPGQEPVKVLSPTMPAPVGNASFNGVTWGASAADLAWILHQDPFRVVLKASAFLKKREP